MGKSSSQKQVKLTGHGPKIGEKIENKIGRRRKTTFYKRKKPQNWFRDNKR
jgi:hypothetical protein